MKKFIFLVILLIQFFHQQVVGTPPPPPPAIPANHFLMVIQWPRAYCSSTNPAQKIFGSCLKDWGMDIDNKFKIHGLWPKPDSIRSSSKFDPYSSQVLIDLDKNDKKRLLTNWRSATSLGIASKTDDIIIHMCSSFWKHEWERHGPYQTLNQRDYFNFVLDRYDELSNIHNDVVTKFRTKSEVKVRVPDIVQYIVSKFGVLVSISCLPYDDTPGKKMLYEIYFNFTLSGQLQNVTNLHGDPCPVNAVFL